MAEQVHILYMEDNDGTARLLEKRLTRAGYQVDTVQNGQEGLERCHSRPYDVFIVDYNMPGLSGIEVLQALNKQGISRPVIMLTGTGNERIAVEALKLGAFDYMVKDIDGVYFDLLPTTIEQALNNQRLIEEKQRAEEALRESEERFRMLFEKAPNPYFVASMAGEFIDSNHAVESMLGQNTSELIGKQITELPFFEPHEIQTMMAVVSELSLGEFSPPFELNIIRPDGDSLAVDIRMIPIKMKGQPQILGIGHDVTWRKQAENKMRAYIQQLETLSRIDDELTRELDIEYVMRMALDHMMNVSGANAGGIAVLEDGEASLMHTVGYPEGVKGLDFNRRSILWRAIRQREPEWTSDVASDPDYLPVLEDTRSKIAIPLVSQERLVGIIGLETNQVDGFSDELFEFLKLIAVRVAVAIDNAQLYEVRQKQLHELQDLYEQVSQLEQLKTDMIRLAAHDLRNPLSTILTKIYLLQKSAAEALLQKQQHDMATIHLAARQMQSLITDFLSVERIEETFQDETEVEILDLARLVARVFETHELQAAENGLNYQLTISAELPLVRGYQAELQQVMTNLIGNAIKYTPQGGNIEVEVSRNEQNVHFEVTDTGYGIPLSQQDRLFQPFVRVQSAETKEIEGAGLGLYLVKKFIQRNRGEIIFQSEYGKGSTFGFSLPLI